MGSFSIPLRPRFVSDSELKIRNAYPGSIPLAILFENRDSKVGYRIVTGIRDSLKLNTPELTGNLANLRQSAHRIWPIQKESERHARHLAGLLV